MARAGVVVIGPGLGKSGWAKMLLAATLEAPQPLVVDADALNLLAADGVGQYNTVFFNGRNAVIHGRQDAVGIANRTVFQLQSFKGLWTGDFVHEMAIHIQQRGTAILFVNQMRIPDLFIHGFFHCDPLEFGDDLQALLLLSAFGEGGESGAGNSGILMDSACVNKRNGLWLNFLPEEA